jgi:hypothetical protein
MRSAPFSPYRAFAVVLCVLAPACARTTPTPLPTYSLTATPLPSAGGEEPTAPTEPGVVTPTPLEPSRPVSPGGGLLGEAPRFPIVPMRLTPTFGATGAEARVDLELRADGTLYSHGQPVGQIVGDRVVSTQGREMMAVLPDGTVTLDGTPTRIRLLDSGEIVRPDGATLAFGNDGVPLSTVPGRPPQRGAMQLTGLRPEARRTAGLLALIVATVALP